MKLFSNQTTGLGGDVFKDFSTFSSNGHLVQQSRTIWAIFVKGHK